jgi:hypothetical protein
MTWGAGGLAAGPISSGRRGRDLRFSLCLALQQPVGPAVAGMARGPGNGCHGLEKQDGTAGIAARECERHLDRAAGSHVRTRWTYGCDIGAGSDKEGDGSTSGAVVEEGEARTDAKGHGCCSAACPTAAAASAEPILPTSADAATTVSGAVTTNDIAASPSTAHSGVAP